MKKKQKTTAEVQAAIFRREHRKSPLRGGVKLTLKKARELALQEFGTAKGIQQEENTLPDYYIMRLGNMRVRIAPDTYGGTGCILIEVRLSGYGRAFQLHDPETLQEDFEAEEQRLRKERREALQDWVGTNGVEACRAEVEKDMERGVKHRPRRRSRPLRVAGSILTANVAFAVLKYTALTAAGVLLFRWGQGYALAERGYKAIGGEALLLGLPLFWYLTETTIRDTVRDFRKGGRRK